MEYYNKIVCVTMEDLTDGNPAVMSLYNYKILVGRRKINIIRPGKGLGNYALIDYYSLPARFRKRFEELRGDPALLLKDRLIPDALPLNRDARRFFMEWQFNDGKFLLDSKIEEYTLNASVLDLLIRELNDRQSFRRALGREASKHLWDTVSGTVEKFRYRTDEDRRLERNPQHTLPKHLSNLKAKIQQYKKEGFACLISGKFGNSNTLKITDEAGRYIIALKRSRVPVYTNGQIFREYNRRCTQSPPCPPQGGVGERWKPLKSLNSLTMFLGRPDVKPLWYDAEHGELAAKQIFTRKNKTKMPSLRDALWYGDGTKLNLYYKTYKDSKLVVKTTAVYEVMDAFSETLLGYHISDTENWEQQYNAYRMAVERSGCKPFEIVTDNQGGSKTKALQEFYRRLCRVARPTQPYNPESKSLESAFGRFQSQVLHRDWRFTGTNISAKTGRANIEFVDANRESLYTLSELKTAYMEAREQWNAMPHPKTGRPRLEMYLNSQNPETQPIDRLDMIEMFWLYTGKPSTFTSAGITIQVNNQKYTYEPLDEFGMPDMDFRRRHTGQQFLVQYDPHDMTHVRLYVESPLGKRYVADAYPYIEVHRAIQEQEDGERSFLVRQNYINQHERIVRQIEAAALEEEHGVAPEQHGLNRPRLRGISARLQEDLGERVNGRTGERKRKMDNGQLTIDNERDYEIVDVGLYEKELSNRVYDLAEMYDKY